jgi:hypothetical protein
MSRNGRQRKYPVEEKLRILEEARQPKTTVAEVLRRHQVDPATFYRWGNRGRGWRSGSGSWRRGERGGRPSTGSVFKLPREGGPRCHTSSPLPCPEHREALHHVSPLSRLKTVSRRILGSEVLPDIGYFSNGCFSDTQSQGLSEEEFTGLEAHASSCTVATVGPSGRRLHSQVVETNAGALIRVLQGIPGTRHLCLEEGTHASWLYEVLSPHVEEIVLAGVSESRGPKSDKLDAFGLAS